MKITAPDTAGITSAYAAAAPSARGVPAPAKLPAHAVADTQMFHGLFQDTDRSAPVAAIVSQLWTTPNVPIGGKSESDERTAREQFAEPVLGYRARLVRRAFGLKVWSHSQRFMVNDLLSARRYDH